MIAMHRCMLPCRQETAQEGTSGDVPAGGGAPEQNKRGNTEPTLVRLRAP